jgi:AmmeMemoRadiSam system protein A
MESMRTAAMDLTEEDKNTLAYIVKKTIQCKLDQKILPVFQVVSEPVKENRGAFVTLKKNGRLRGCIGYIEAKRPLYETVREMAIASAFNDPRFPPLKRDELPHLTLEISVLTPLKLIKEIEEIEIGVHGLYIVRGYRSGLLLPQVAIEYKWDSLTFLEETCCKAGLSPEAWKEEDTKIYIFSANVFGRHW